MKSLFLILFLLLFSIISVSSLWAQGCSDAGFCSIGGMQPDHSFSAYDSFSIARTDTFFLAPKTYTNSISFISTFGEGDDRTRILTPALQYAHVFNNRLEVQIKLNGNIANGNMGKASGPGDLFLSGTYTLHSENKWKWLGTAGIKIPLNKSDLSYSFGGTLPMAYQSSLGTVDALVGLSLAHRNFRFSVGYQQPLTSHNNNQYIQENQDGTMYEAFAQAYPNTRLFQRRADLLCRASYINSSLRNFKLMLGGLAIYHVADDTYKDPADNHEVEIKHSAGLTLNITAGITYTPVSWLSLSLHGGKPVIVRKVRPDGLTRHWVLMPEVSFAF